MSVMEPDRFMCQTCKAPLTRVVLDRGIVYFHKLGHRACNALVAVFDPRAIPKPLVNWTETELRELWGNR